jgi:hypothetical protein
VGREKFKKPQRLRRYFDGSPIPEQFVSLQIELKGCEAKFFTHVHR